jgi:hypothetical protein
MRVRVRRIRTLICGAVLLPLSTAAAQPLDTVALRVGQRVRVTGAPEYQPLSFTARVARLPGDSLWFRADDGQTVFALSRERIARLEVSLGKPRYRRRTAIGAVSGAVVAAGVTTLAARVFGGQRGLEVAPVLIALVVLPGTYAGAVIGVAGLKEEWAPARVSEPPR